MVNLSKPRHRNMNILKGVLGGELTFHESVSVNSLKELLI